MKRLAQLLEIDQAELAKKLADTKREFIYIKRHLPPEEAVKLSNTDLFDLVAGQQIADDQLSKKYLGAS